MNPGLNKSQVIYIKVNITIFLEEQFIQRKTVQLSLATCLGLEFLVHSSVPTQCYVLNYKKNKRKKFHLDKENSKLFFLSLKRKVIHYFCVYNLITKQNKIKKSIPFPTNLILLKYVAKRTHTRNVFTNGV